MLPQAPERCNWIKHRINVNGNSLNGMCHLVIFWCAFCLKNLLLATYLINSVFLIHRLHFRRFYSCYHHCQQYYHPRTNINTERSFTNFTASFPGSATKIKYKPSSI